MIITGAGLPLTMPEATKNYPDVALVPIVSTAKALRILCKRWKKTHSRLPDAIIVEGPLSGGHQGFKYDECFMEENQLENILPPVVEEAKNWGSMPIIAAGGVWDHDDIQKMLDLGADAVQMGTRFIGTVECDTSEVMKQMIIASDADDIKLFKSPVGYPARGINSQLHADILTHQKLHVSRIVLHLVTVVKKQKSLVIVLQIDFQMLMTVLLKQDSFLLEQTVIN